MQFREGKCGSCGATFKVPASFGGDKAKCKSCGQGVVAIGPVLGKPPQEEGLEEYTPSGKHGGGPSMLERLRAERAAAEAGAVPVPASKPPAARPAAQKPASQKPAARRPAAAARPSGAKKPGRPVARGGAAAGGTTSRGGARRAGATRGRRRGEQDDEGGDDGRRGRRPEKRSPLPALLAVLVLAGVAIGAWQLMGGGDAPEAPPDAGVAAAETTEDPGAAFEDPDEDLVPEDDVDDEGTDPAAQGDEEDAAAPPEPELEPIPKSTPDSEVDPSVIDLASFPPLEKDPECSDDEWERIEELARVMADDFSPRQAAQARDELCDIGRFAYPAMVNQFMLIDMHDRDGYINAGFFQNGMEKLLGGRNYGWKTDIDDEPNKTILFNKKVIKKFYDTWSKISGSAVDWNKLSNNPANTSVVEEEKPKEDIGVDVSDLDDLDDLDG